jgi:hypothetical protein
MDCVQRKLDRDLYNKISDNLFDGIFNNLQKIVRKNLNNDTANLPWVDGVNYFPEIYEIYKRADETVLEVYFKLLGS